jgi:alkylated DNA nucleotide flippase Atl1
MENQAATFTLEYKVDFNNGKGKHKFRKRSAAPKATPSKIPRIAKLLALTHHLQGLLDQGVVKDYADIARLSGLSRARVTQIMNLALLAPQIQEDILFSNNRAMSKVKERTVRIVLKKTTWKQQAREWKKLESL